HRVIGEVVAVPPAKPVIQLSRQLDDGKTFDHNKLLAVHHDASVGHYAYKNVDRIARFRHFPARRSETIPGHGSHTGNASTPVAAPTPLDHMSLALAQVKPASEAIWPASVLERRRRQV